MLWAHFNFSEFSGLSEVYPKPPHFRRGQEVSSELNFRKVSGFPGFLAQNQSDTHKI